MNNKNIHIVAELLALGLSFIWFGLHGFIVVFLLLWSAYTFEDWRKR